MRTIDLIKKYSHIFGTDYTQDANCKGAWLMEIDEDPLTDSSGEGRTGALQSAGHPDFKTATPPPGGYSLGYYDFDGLQDYVDVTVTGAGFLSSAVGAVTLWVKPTVNSLDAIFHLANSSTNDEWGLFLRCSAGGNLEVLIRSDIGPTWVIIQDSDNVVFSTGTWAHVAVTQDGTGYIAYIDGVAQDMSDAYGQTSDDLAAWWDIPVSQNRLRFGARGDSVKDDYFDGDLDELSIFTRDLDSTEVNDIKDNGLQGPQGNPYPKNRLRKDVISGYHCFMNAYIRAKVEEFDPLKLPDGTVF